MAAELGAAGAAAEIVAWDDPDVGWERFDRVVIRSTWDYTGRRDDFLAWADRVGPDRLRNRPGLVRWNSDKAYLDDLRAAGVPVIETAFVGPHDPPPALAGEVVVKPTVSAGARDTGRFSPPRHDQARALLERLRRSGRTAMVQPYAAGVETAGETAIVFLGGRESHVLRKRAVLRPDEEAPIREEAIVAAEVMFSDDLVGPGQATGAEREVARAVSEHVAGRFGATPLYARVDLAPGPDGEPTLMELEAVEPNLYLSTAPGSAQRFAAAILADR